MTARRDPTNELYDRACDLLDAARELHLSAAREGTDEAIAATLGCVEAALGELAERYRVLGGAGDRMLRAAGLSGGGPRLEAEARFASVAAALDRAVARSVAARAAVGPALAELAISRSGWQRC